LSLYQELGLQKPFLHHAHEAVLNIVHTGTLLEKEGHRVLHPFGITEAQFNVLMLLKEQSVDGVINQTRLGNMLLVNRSNVTGLIDRMEKSGLVRRTADPDDRRVNQIEMTESGGLILKKARKAYYSRLEEIMSAFSKEEYNLICKLMEHIRAQVRTL